MLYGWLHCNPFHSNDNSKALPWGIRVDAIVSFATVRGLGRAASSLSLSRVAINNWFIERTKDAQELLEAQASASLVS